MTMRVLVTRPQPGAAATARRLEALGHVPVVLPLTRTVAVDPGGLPDPAGFDAVIATSAAAIRHAPGPLLARIAHLPLHAVADRTAQAARAAGFRAVAGPLPDAATMVAELPDRLRPGGRLLYLAGKVRTGLAEAGLAAAGLDVRTLEIYDTTVDEDAVAGAAGRIGAGSLDAALVHSANSAAVLSRLAARPDLAPRFAGMHFLCISARVAGALGGGLAARAAVAAAPDEAAMLALLGPADGLG